MSTDTPKEIYPPILPQHPHFLHGADYNPEQWLEYPEVLARDIELMKKANITTVSIGIFSWTTYEKEEGIYTFDWLDRIMDSLAHNGMFAFLATPSAAKPFWLSEKYPEVRRVRENGTREMSGSRHNYCMSSPVYREKISDLDSRLAQRYQNHPALALWHINNEVGGECFCNYCMERFHTYLKDKYKTLENLDQTYWTRFWSHTYTDWNQIRPHDYGIDSMIIDRRRFFNDLHVDFIKHEISAVKKYTPYIPCTTNFMGSIESHDYWRWVDALDIVSNDSYPAYDARGDRWKRASDTSFNFDMMRSFKQGKPWILMESTPSSVNWHRVNKLKRPGMHMMEMVQAIAHGAEAIHYFQWRKGRAGFEKHHGAVVDHAGHENTRVFKEVAEVGAMLSKLDPVIGSTVKAEVALLFDSEVAWTVLDSPGIKLNPKDEPYSDNTYARACKDHYRGLWRQGITIDTINRHQDFSKYKLLVAPAFHMLEPGMAEKFRTFVANGGTLLCTYLTGWVDEFNRTLLGGWPGNSLMELFGIWDEETDYLYEDDKNWIKCSEGNELDLDGEYPVQDICAVIHTTTARVLATYGNDYYKDSPVLTINQFGKGKAYYLAAKPDDTFLKHLYKALINLANINKCIDTTLPDGVSIYTRTNGKDTFYFLINYDRIEKTLDLGLQKFRNITNNCELTGKISLPPYQTHICIPVK